MDTNSNSSWSSAEVSKLQQNDQSQGDSITITPEERHNLLEFCALEFPLFDSSFKFSPYGASSLELPSFHAKNINNLTSTAYVGDFQYSPMTGRKDLINSILQNFGEIDLFETKGSPIMGSNILVTSGALPGITASIEALCVPGDEIIVFSPVYPAHLIKRSFEKFIFKAVQMVFNPKKNQFEFDFNAFENALSAKTKIVIITNPNNPLGRVYTREELMRISKILEDYPRVNVIDDHSYFLYYQEGHKPIPFATIQPNNFERTLTFYSCGKMFNVTGLRVGFCVADKEIISVVQDLILRDSQYTSSFEQMLIRDNFLSANEKEEGSLNYYEETNLDIIARMKKMKTELSKYRIRVLESEGTYYLLLDIENLRGKIDGKFYKTLHKPEESTKELDKAFARMLFLEEKLGVFPLSPFFFGKDRPDNLVRVSVNRNDEELQLFLSSFKTIMNTINL